MKNTSDKIYANSHKCVMDRTKQFFWQINPFLLPIYHFYEDQINLIADQDENDRFDLAVQFIKHLSKYRVEEVWKIPITDLIELRSYEKVQDFYTRFKDLLISGRIIPNDRLINKEIIKICHNIRL